MVPEMRSQTPPAPDDVPRLIVHLMRHAKANYKDGNNPDEAIRDPELTPEGIQQCSDFKNQVFGDWIYYIDHILCSPMTRTISTTLEAFPEHGDSGSKIFALPQLQSLNSGPNGRGLGLTKLTALWHAKKHLVDVTTHGQKDWNEKKKGKWSSKEISWRTNHIKGLLQGLQIGGRGELVEVVIVSHGSFLETLMPQDYKSAKLYSYTFDSDGDLQPITRDEVYDIRSSYPENLI